MAFKNWLSWTGYVRLYARTSPEFERPNVVFHAAQNVRTPVGEAPVAILLYKSSPGAYPEIKDIVSPDPRVAAYVSLVFFQETPFESYVPRRAILAFNGDGQETFGVKAHVGRYTLQCNISGIGESGLVHREPSHDCPVFTQAVECTATDAAVMFNNNLQNIILPGAVEGWGSPVAYSPVGFWVMPRDISASVAA